MLQIQLVEHNTIERNSEITKFCLNKKQKLKKKKETKYTQPITTKINYTRNFIDQETKIRAAQCINSTI